MEVLVLLLVAGVCGSIGQAIGGFSRGGCIVSIALGFIGALLVGLTANYIGFLAPKVALGSNILLMAMILLWRPQGLFPVAKR